MNRYLNERVYYFITSTKCGLSFLSLKSLKICQMDSTSCFERSFDSFWLSLHERWLPFDHGNFSKVITLKIHWALSDCQIFFNYVLLDTEWNLFSKIKQILRKKLFETLMNRYLKERVFFLLRLHKCGLSFLSLKSIKICHMKSPLCF